jgi:hypothetical protein
LGNKEILIVAAASGVKKTRLWIAAGAAALVVASGAVAQDSGQDNSPPA